MANINRKDAASFNMKAVVNETGIKPDTLRVWERRYGLPQPERTSGGHRIYSQRDVETLKWLIARQEEGLSISRAVGLWNQYLADGKDPLLALPLETRQIAHPFIAGAMIDGLRDEWVEACLDFNEQQAEAILARAFALYPPDQVCIQVLMGGISQIGTGWHLGNFTVQQEHFASELATRRVETLIAASPPPPNPEQILVICPPSEEHTFSPLLLTYLLRRSGKYAQFLGANVPLERLEDAIINLKPDLIILAVQQLLAAAQAFFLAKKITAMGIMTAYGGMIFNQIPALRERIPGIFLGETIEQGAANVSHLLRHPMPIYEVEEFSEEYKNALNSFQSHLANIESMTMKEMMAMDIPHPHLFTANIHLAQNIIAALTLGDITFLDYDIHWVMELLSNYNILDENLDRYLSAYAEAVSRELGSEGELISNYLHTLVNNDQNLSIHFHEGSHR